MRKNLGLGVLLAGVAGLGWWGTTHEAHRMETAIATAAAALNAGATHEVTAVISGRDIEVTGLADTEAERASLMAAYEAVPGRRVVRDSLRVLAPATPFVTSIDKAADGGLTASGNIANETARARLADMIGAAGAAPLVLASGANPDQFGLTEVGVAALAPLNHGRAEVADGLLHITGEANTPTERAAMQAVLDQLPPGMSSSTVTLLDDGTPPDWRLEFTALTGATLSGKLPRGFDLAGLSAMLGLPSVQSTAKTALTGDTPALPALFAGLKRWLPDLETLTVGLPATGKPIVQAGVGKGADLDLIRSGMAADLGDVDLTVTEIAASAAEGSTRQNLVTGQTERLTAGFWLPVAQFTVDKATCQAQADTLLAETTVNFLSGSDRLDASALRVLNRLAAVMAPCAGSGLRAEIGGHTDASGDAAANIGLSQRRAEAVRTALTARGVTADMLRATGFGAAQPIADNATEEGRAKNRRTTVTWSE